MKFGNLKSVVEKYAYLWPFAFTALIILVVVVAAAVSVPNASVTPAVPNSLALETYLDENEENGDVQVIAVKVLEADPNTPPAVAELRFSYDIAELVVDRIIGYEGTLYLNNKVDSIAGAATIDVAHAGPGAFEVGDTIALIYVEKLGETATITLDLETSSLGYPNNIDMDKPVAFSL